MKQRQGCGNGSGIPAVTRRPPSIGSTDDKASPNDAG